MPDTSPILALPYIQPAQAQKHVTHNEALRRLDLIVQLAVTDRDRTSPPPAPAEGDRHIVASGATADWAGHDGQIAVFDQGLWQFVAPLAGWQAQVLAEAETARFDGSVWTTAAERPQQLTTLGISTPADLTNRLAVAAPATLFTHAGAGHQIKVNKAAPTDTASLLFQSGWSGRAELGLAGSDAFSLKISGDGTTWAEALHIDAAGRVGIGTAPATTLDVAGIARLRPLSIAELPDAGDAGAGALAWVSDAAGGAQLACSDGTDWRKVRDGLPV